MIDTKLLRQKILDLAIRGKLVPQNPADEPASELLKKIKAEKEALVKAGKIKKDKHESFIFRGDDKRYYWHVVGEKNFSPITLPFQLPQNWLWVNLGDIMDIARGGSPRPIDDYLTNEPNGYNWIKIGDVSPGSKYITSTKEKIRAEGLSKTRYVESGDFLLTNSMSFGRPYILKTNGCIHDGWLVLHPLPPTIDADFLFYALSSTTIYELLRQAASGSTVKNLNSDTVKQLYFPLPPLVEQKRIVAQIESLLKFVDEIDKESETLEKSIKLAKQKVLDLAIRGKLVPQNPEDEPASELMKRINAEKEALVKAGKLKKNKHESFIFRGDDNCYHENIDGKSSDITGEIPFELPQSWIWCRIGNIGTINPRNHVADDSTMVSFMPMTQLEGGYGSNYTLSERTWQDVKTGFTHIQENDVVFAKITPCFQNRKSAIMRGLKNGYGAGTTELHVIRCFFPVFPEYILWFLKNQTFISDAVSTIQGVVGQQRIDANFIRNYLLPLPPLSEQKRIVAQVEKLLSVLETMRG